MYTTDLGGSTTDTAQGGGVPEECSSVVVTGAVRCGAKRSCSFRRSEPRAWAKR